MNFINNIYFVGGVCWRNRYFISNLANIIYSCVGGGINFYNIQGGVAVYLFAVAALVAGLSLRVKFCIRVPFFAVQEFGDQAGGCGFARAPGAIK